MSAARVVYPRAVATPNGKWSYWVVTCPSCGRDGRLTDAQFHGRESVDHASQFEDCDWHETIDFARLLDDLVRRINEKRTDRAFMERLAGDIATHRELLDMLADEDPTPSPVSPADGGVS